MSLVESAEKAAIYRPSREQRGLNNPSEPVTSEMLEVCKSTTLMLGADDFPYSNHGMAPKMMESPLGIQVGSPSLRPSEVNSCGVPPWAETTKIFHGLPGRNPMNAIRVPSGDHRGECASRGAKVS